MQTSDITKTFGPLLDRRTCGKLGFTGPPTVLQDLIFFNIRFFIEGRPKIFFTRQQNHHNTSKGFHRSSAVLTGRGPRNGGFRDVWNMLQQVNSLPPCDAICGAGVLLLAISELYISSTVILLVFINSKVTLVLVLVLIFTGKYSETAS